MTLIGSVGRWHGALPKNERDLQNELKRHRAQITELLGKKRDVAMLITSHYQQIRKLKRLAKRQGIAL